QIGQVFGMLVAPMRTRAAASTTRTPAAPRIPRIGELLRQLRVAAGLTQTDLAGDRFSKEYISQIERGKTRPTTDTVEWLALRLGIDAGFLQSGVSADERAKAEAILARADALSQEHKFPEAIAEYTRALPAVLGTGAAELRVRALNGEAMAQAQAGDVKSALALLAEARGLVESETFTDVDRADVLYRLGVCRYKLSSISTAVALFDEALSLAERSGLPCDELKLNIFAWRSRCYRRQRDYEASREDGERALELAEALRDARALAPMDFQLGNPDNAIERFKQAYAIALEVDRAEDAATAVNSLAQVHLRTGDVKRAEEQARHALEIIGEREDMLDEVGNARLVLGRALLEQGRLDEAESAFAGSEDAFAQLSSASHRAAAWIAQGDLATRRGEERRAAVLYRRAAEALQDFRF